MEGRQNAADMNKAASDLIDLIDSRSKKAIEAETKRSVKTKNGIVVSYDDTAYSAVVSFPEDGNNVLNTYYNKTGEILSEGDNVKVYYTTNPAKGWIGLRLGEPHIKEVKQIIPYSSHSFVNGNDTDISDLASSPLNLDFTTLGNTSDTVVVANQIINITKPGTILSEYYVDGIKSDNVHTERKDVGAQVITHVVPMSVLAGEHNLLIRQSSGDGARGTCDSGKLFGVVSGQLDSLCIEEPPNDNIILKVEVTLGEQFELWRFTGSNGAATGLVYWGDGTSETYNSGLNKYHIYGSEEEQLAIGDAKFAYKGLKASLSDIEALTDAKAGDIWDIGTSDSYIKYFRTSNEKWAVMTSHGTKKDFKVTITAKIAHMEHGGYLDSGGYQNNETIVKEVVFSDYVQSISNDRVTGNAQGGLFDGNTSLTSVRFGKNIRVIGGASFRGTGISGVVRLPPNLTGLDTGCFWRCQSITAVIAECPMLNTFSRADGAFSGCSNLTTVVWNAPHISYIFENCQNLSKVTLGENLGGIGWSSFKNCSALSEIKIPESVGFIDHHAFIGTNIREVTLPPNCTYYREGASFQSFPNGCIIHGGIPIT